MCNANYTLFVTRCWHDRYDFPPHRLFVGRVRCTISVHQNVSFFSYKKSVTDCQMPNT